MNKSAPTPGPWKVEQSDCDTAIVRMSDGRTLARYGMDRIGIDIADAYLISAAPDMLAALKELKAASIILDECAGAVTAAIAKAEGQ